MVLLAHARATRVARNGMAMLCALAAGTLCSAAAGLSGSAALNAIDSIVVVYPADGGDTGLNRLSGRRRAGFLHNLLGMQTDFVADNEITDEQLRSNLLVLGWDNGLLGSERAPRPFTRSGGGWRFVESIEVGPGEDLMFATASPYNAAAQLFFWSRIDLELDTFSVLPFLGSDWVIYRGYEVVRQGMFRDVAVWPPQRNPAAEAEQPNLRRLFRAQGQSEHYTVHHTDGLIDSAERSAILRAREQALATALAALSLPGEELHIDLYLYENDKQKDQLTGVPDPVHSLGRLQELHMLVPHARSPNPHEEIHLVARVRFGPCHYTALHEGLAMALEHPDAEGDLAVYAAALIEQEALPSIDEVLDEEGIRVLNRRGLGFPAAGLFVRWLLDRGGSDLVGSVYSELPLDEAKLARALGLDPGQADPAFREWVAALAEAGDDEYHFRGLVAAGDLCWKDEDWPGAVEQFEAALKLRPGDAATQYKLGLAEMQLGRLDKAEARFRKIIETVELNGSAEDRYAIFAHYQLGQVLERSNRAAEARDAYRRMLDLPDRYGSHRMATQALGKPAT